MFLHPTKSQESTLEITSDRLNLIVASTLFVAALGIYGVSDLLVGRAQSPMAAYFQYLADAFLHGRLYVVDTPSHNDLTFFAGHWYVGFPPLAALLLMPWVALRGVAHVNTVLFGAAVGAFNVALAFLLLQSLAQRKWTKLSLIDNVWLTVLFGLGSVHWHAATQGTVWHLGSLCAVPFMLLAVWFGVTTGSPLLSGGGMAVAMLSRPHVVFSYPVLAGIAFQQIRDKMTRDKWYALLRWVILSGIPIGLTVALLLIYNYARFGHAFDFGYYTMNIDPAAARDLHTYGQFSTHYFLHNLWTMLFEGPDWNPALNRPVLSANGLSLIFTMPILVYLLRVGKHAIFVAGAWTAVGFMLVPLLTYFNTGFEQFGYRYSLDFIAPLLVLLAVAVEENRGWQMRVLVMIGVLVNAWGVWWFRFFV